MIRKLCPLLFFTFLLFQASGGNISSHHDYNYSFIENKGQWNPAILFRSELPGGVLFLEKQCITYQFVEAKAYSDLMGFKLLPFAKRNSMKPPSKYLPGHAYKVELIGSNDDAIIRKSGKLPDYNNYFIGNDSRTWADDVRKYTEVRYEGIYRNVDVTFGGHDGTLKYTFFAKGGSDPGNICLRYNGVDKVTIKKGNLVIKTSVNSIVEESPVAWQIDLDGNKKFISCRFKVKNNVVTFEFPEGYDKTKELVIDPVLVFSSYSGSPTDNWGYTATYDRQGFLYAGGSTFALGYPTTLGAYQVLFSGGSSDIVITKYDTTGSTLIYSTYIGGSEAEVPTSLVVNNSNELYILGSTSSTDYPTTTNAYDQTFNGGIPYMLTWVLEYPNGSDIVVTKLASNGRNLLASTFYGGSGNDGLNSDDTLKHNYADDPRGEIKVDENNNIYVVSSTQSLNLPGTSASFQPSIGGEQDACVFKMNGSLSSLYWASYYGGSRNEGGYSLVFDGDYNVYIAGGTSSTNLPVTANCIHPTYQGGTSDGFIARISSSGTSLLSGTYYGSNLYDQIYFIDRNKTGAIFVLGQTAASGQTFISNVTWSTPGGGQFISKLSETLQSVTWSTAFGTGNGGPDISPTAFLIDLCGNIYVSGWGSSSLNGFGGTSGLPVSANAFQTTTDNSDYYFFVMNPDASGMVYGTFFGGTSLEHVDGGTSRFDKKGKIYQSVCAGCGGNNTFPTTPGAWSNTNGSTNCNNGVIKFDFNIILSVADFIVPPVGCAPYTVTFINTSLSSPASGVQYSWNFGDGGTSSLFQPTHTFVNQGVYTITLILTDPNSCNAGDTIKQHLVVLDNSNYGLPDMHICSGQSAVIGIPPPPDPTISYSWTPSFGLDNTSIPNPNANPPITMSYTLMMSNGQCTDTIHQTVQVHNLQVNAGNDTVICSTGCNLTAHTNETVQQIIWSTNRYFSDTLNNLSDSIVSVLLTNQVSWFYVMASNSACSVIDSIKVSFTILISPASGSNPSCPGICDGNAGVFVSGGTPPLTYLWNSGQNTPTINNLCDGIFTVTVTDSANCKSVASISLIDPEGININVISKNIPCTEVCNGSINCTLSGGTPPYSYIWNTGDLLLQLDNLCSGSYTISVTDSNLCLNTTTINITAQSIFQNISVSIDNDTIYKGQSSHIFSTSLPGVTYAWSPAAGLDYPFSNNPLATPLQSTTYYLTITDSYGCKFVDSVRIFVKEVFCRDPFVYVPNAFTPNADNLNDNLMVYGVIIEDLSFSVYDRWGEKLFETTDQKQGWNGTFKGKACDPGVYVFQLNARCFDQSVYKNKGNVTLLR